jgi:hypothetical protein
MSHAVVWILNNPITLGILCFCLVIFPIVGIWYVHK